MQTLGSTSFQIGLAVGILAIGEIIFKTPFGLWADRVGKLKVMILGLVIFSIASFCYLFINNPLLITFIRFMQGVGIAAYSPASIALVADLFAKSKGQSLGIYNTIKGVGYALGPIVGGIIVSTKLGLPFLFLLSGALAVVIALLSYIFLKNKEEKIDGKNLMPAHEALKESFKFRYFTAYFIGMTGMFVFYTIISFMGVYAKSFDISTFQSGLILSVQSGIYILFLTFAGKITDKIGAKIPSILGAFFCALAVLLISFFSVFIILIISAVLSGAGVAFLWVSSTAYLAEISPKNILGTVMGVDGTFKEIGDAGGPILIGFLAGIFSLKNSFLFCLVFIGISIVFSLFLKRKA